VKSELPAYLARPVSGGETYGTLRRDGAQWVLEAEPQVIVMAKRLFHGSNGRGQGIAKFPANKRSFGDLVWFLQRYPLEVKDREAFEKDYAQACGYALKRQQLLSQPVSGVPDASFTGVLSPFQQEGLSWILTHRRTLLADEMGLGKTVQALAFLATEQNWPALIVPPPHLVGHWAGKIQQFLACGEGDAGPLFQQGGITVHVIRGRKPYPLPNAHIYIIHYLLLASWRATLKEMNIPRVVFDEIQELRHTGTEKYSAASEIASLAPDVVGLSGTPIYNRGAEIWSVMNIIEYHCLGDKDSFTREWCTAYQSETVADPAVLGAHLRREGLMLRRRKEDVLTDLPPKRRIVEDIESDDSLYNELIKGAVALASHASMLTDHLARGRAELEAMNETRRATGVAKAVAASAFVRSMLEADEPTLVFAYHHDVVDILKSELSDFNPVCITGRESSAEKIESQLAFQSGKTNVCIISLRAAAGIDGLQERARIVVFAELDWSPAVHSQAEDRAHRIGQRDSILCYYLVSEYGTDPSMQEALGLKVSQFLGLMGDSERTPEDNAIAVQAAHGHMKAVLARLRARTPSLQAVAP